MKSEELEALARAVRAEELPVDAVLLKSNPVRRVVRRGETVLKVFLMPGTRAAAREAACLRRAEGAGIPVPALRGHGADWVATAWCPGRPAERGDLERLLPIVDQMHSAGLLHRDLHLGNFLIDGERVTLLDVQRALFLPFLPQWLRRWELGRLAYSLGEPLAERLAPVRRWRDLRAHQHWRSRTRRCLKESSRFTRFELDGAYGFRLREVSPEDLRRTFTRLEEAELIWPRPGGHIYRSGGWIVKQHIGVRDARAAWIAGHGLEARGIRTARPLAWVDRWLIMEDAGRTVVEWVEEEFAGASTGVQEETVEMLVDLMADLHRRGIYHADMKACNIIWSPGQAPRLLDYERVRFGWSVPQRRRTKNLAQLNSALPDVIPGALRELGLRRYVERSRFRGDVDRLRRDVVALSLARAHRWHGC